MDQDLEEILKRISFASSERPFAVKPTEAWAYATIVKLVLEVNSLREKVLCGNRS